MYWLRKLYYGSFPLMMLLTLDGPTSSIEYCSKNSAFLFTNQFAAIVSCTLEFLYFQAIQLIIWKLKT